jgi:hypothetical protein
LSASPASTRVVSYFLSASADSPNWIPWGSGPWETMPAYNWEWRIFDPSTGRDELYLRLPSYPLLIRWDPSFASVEFLLRDRIVRTEWMFGSRIQDQVGLPADSCLCDFWFADDTWHVVTQEEVPTVWPDGRAAVAQLGKRWDLEASTRAWHVAAVDSQAGGHYGECFVTRQLERGAPRPAAIRMQSFVDSMSLGTGRDICLMTRTERKTRTNGSGCHLKPTRPLALSSRPAKVTLTTPLNRSSGWTADMGIGERSIPSGSTASSVHS